MEEWDAVVLVGALEHQRRRNTPESSFGGREVAVRWCLCSRVKKLQNIDVESKFYFVEAIY
jgi:hypothetical protein